MSTIRKKVASVMSFAHLTGFAKASGNDDDKDRRDDAEEDDPDKKDQDRENGNSKKGKKAKGDGDDKDDKNDESADDESPDDKDKDKNDNARGDDSDSDADEDDDEDEMRGKSAAASARRRERTRCAAIFASKAAGKNPALAANLAFNTSMTRKEALAVLENTPAADTSGAGRSARNPGIAAGGANHGTSPQATASRWDAAFKKASPRR